MVVDLLQGARPRRLVFSRSKWHLEIMRLEAVSNAIFQPRIQRIEGTEAILAFLSRTEEGRPLLQATYEILRSESGEENRSYDAVDGEWIPTAVAPSYMKELDQRRRRPKPQASSASQQLELRSELMLLRSAYEQLKRRVKEIERRLESGAFAAPAPAPVRVPDAPGASAQALAAPGTAPPSTSGPAAPGIGAVPGASAPGAEAPHAAGSAPTSGAASVPGGASVPGATPGHGVAAAHAATQAGPALSEGGAPPVPTDVDAPNAFGATVEAVGAAVSASPPKQKVDRLRLPPVSALSRFIGQALGDDVTLAEAPKPPDWDTMVEHYYVARLVDDSGNDIGAILVEQQAIVYLGGTLLMLPPATIEVQAKQKEPTEDTLEATSEIFNILTASINSLPGAIHVRSEHLEPVQVENSQWIVEAKHAVFATASVGGSLALIAR